MIFNILLSVFQETVILIKTCVLGTMWSLVTNLTSYEVKTRLGQASLDQALITPQAKVSARSHNIYVKCELVQAI